MRHRILGRQLNRTAKLRWSLFRSMLHSLFTYGFITSTEAKLKSILNNAEKIAGLAIKGDMNSIKEINKTFDNDDFTAQVVAKVQASLVGRTSNFLKIQRVKMRQGDNALISKLSFYKDLVAPAAEVKKEEKKVKASVKKKLVVKKTK
ncbi:MAG: L17 family ribosomal protein [Candidatus Shapirobacteria bacterium]